MTPEELLELAAKAAGAKWDAATDEYYLDGRWGNPLTDDGDALRLAVKLCLDVEVEPVGKAPSTNVRRIDGKWVVEYHKDDPYAATRRAITRAAAEIGKEMP